jgi:calcineurin-like phosphoesterase family protein
MARFFTSDTHVRHKKISEYTQRGLVTTAEAHDAWVVDFINKQVKPGDTLYILGDVAFTADSKVVEDFLSQINCMVVVIKGNHDSRKVWKRVQHHKLLACKDYDEIKMASGQTACLFHFPIHAWHKQGYGSYHLHGHTHANYEGVGKSLDVGIDNAYKLYGEHRLFTEQDIEAYMATREVVVTDGHVNRADQRGHVLRS